MPDRISVRVPATSANLGCLFDCAALALSLYLDVHVIPRKDCRINVQYSGVNPERIPTDDTNLIARAILQTLKTWDAKCGFDLEIQNQIPVGVGLGSSAAAIVAGIAACHWLADENLFDEELLTRATLLEGHPDNVAAAWQGGFTLAAHLGERVVAYSCPVPDSLQCVLVVPDYALPTEQARRALPEQYSRADAVHNLQRASAVAANFFSGKIDLQAALFDDRWHQPYRAKLVPGLAQALEFTHPDLLGVCLSGGGPSILALARGSALAIGEGLRARLAGQNVKAQTYVLSADNRGAKGWSVPT
jgi:homoserine kinase